MARAFRPYLACSGRPGDGEGKLFLSFDITDWKRAEEALRESEEKYSNLVENAPTGVFIYQHDKLAFVNPKFAQLLESSRDELLEVNAWSLVHGDDRERVREIARTRAFRGAGRPMNTSAG